MVALISTFPCPARASDADVMLYVHGAGKKQSIGGGTFVKNPKSGKVYLLTVTHVLDNADQSNTSYIEYTFQEESYGKHSTAILLPAQNRRILARNSEAVLIPIDKPNEAIPPTDLHSYFHSYEYIEAIAEPLALDTDSLSKGEKVEVCSYGRAASSVSLESKNRYVREVLKVIGDGKQANNGEATYVAKLTASQTITHGSSGSGVKRVSDGRIVGAIVGGGVYSKSGSPAYSIMSLGSWDFSQVP